MNARMERICLRGTLLAALIGFAGCGGETPDGTVDPNCALDDPDGDEGEKSPGHPFSFELFRNDVVPILVAGCATAGCHAPGTPPQGGNGNFQVWAGAVDNDCDRVQTFKSARDQIDLANPAASRLHVAITTGQTAGAVHPASVMLGNVQQGDADKILSFIMNANATCSAEGTCGGAPEEQVDFYDYEVFKTDVQPAINAANCSAGTGCHAAPATAARGFILIPNATAEADMDANYDSVKTRISLQNLDDPTDALFYFNAVTPHAGGVSTQIAAGDRAAVEAWIQAAITAFDNSAIPDTGCADPALLDVRVFEDDILPILRGEVDLNNRNDDGTATGCTRGPCHGRPIPGGMSLIPTAPIEEQLANFACFVNLASPSSSPVVQCPQNLLGCPKYPHPGDKVFDDADDLNYQALLSFLFSTSNTNNIPLDLAFFARRVNPTFDDVNAVDAGAQNRTCASTDACHGVQAEGLVPPNGSNFGIIPNAGNNLNVLKINFVEAAAFTNFIEANQSSLFLYPTGQIFNEDNPAATGLLHPGCNSEVGGGCFPIDSVFATNMLTFAAGLTPDPNTGDQLNWLIAGDFQGIVDIDDNTPVDEDNERPALFDRSGGQELAGRWDAVFFDEAVAVNGEQVVDVNAFLDGVAGNGRAAFANAYVFNATAVRQELKFVLTSVNDTRIYVGNSIAEGDAGETVTLTTFLEPSRAGEQPEILRVLVKLFEEVGQQELNFNLKILDENNQPFDAQEIIIKLNDAGSI